MRKLSYSILACLLTSLGAYAQGLRFEQGKTWEQVLAQAKQSHKNVFVNCYMQGGKPCEEMDAQVFPVKTVGDYYNAHYVSIAMNMEALPTDEKARTARVMADTIRNRYHVNGYPNLLFLDANGTLLHRYLGSMTPDAFITLGKDALDPHKQYTMQIAAFKAGVRDTAIMRQLAESAFTFGDSKISYEIAKAYLQGKTNAQLANMADMGLIGYVLQDHSKLDTLTQLYLANLSTQQLLQPENMRLLIQAKDQPDTVAHYVPLFLQHPDSVLLQRTSLSVLVQAAYLQGLSGKAYDYLWAHHQAADSAFQQPLSLLKLFSRAISKDIIMPFLKQTGDATPDWEALRQAITSPYDAVYADRCLLQTKLGWYGARKDWATCMPVIVEIDRKFGALRPDYEINNEVAIPMLTHSTDTALLQYALGRMQQVVTKQSPSTSQVNTYAALLYNTGNKAEAIRWEKIALEAAPKDKDIVTTLEQMNNGTFTTLKP